MTKEKPRLVRLTAIITQLLSKRVITAREIAEKYDVSIRTVYRDIRTLEQSGIPILTEEGRGYSLMEGYALPPVMFTEEEAHALITSEQLILKNKDRSLTEHFQHAITKIRSVLRHRQKSSIEMLEGRLQVRAGTEHTSQSLIQLQSNIANFQVVQMGYLSLDGTPSQREIEPFALYTTKDNWILIAYCRSRKDFRAFRLDRIQHLVTLEETFQPHDMTLEQYLETCRKKMSGTPDIPMTHPGNTFVET